MSSGTKKSNTVIGLGTAVVDYIGVVAEHPAADTQVELQKFSKQPGGNVATALVTLARLGVQTGFLGKFGDDELGRFVENRMLAEGIDLSSSLTQTGGSMGFAFIIVESGSGRRTILWTNDGKSHLQLSEIDTDAILASQYLHLDHYSIHAAIAAAKIARTGNVQVVLDAEAMPSGIEILLPLVDVLIVCADFARNYCQCDSLQEALDTLHDTTNAHTVAITDGENGSYCRDASQTHRQVAFKVEPVDTTGCGDVYHGAFIFGLIEGWPLPQISRFASAAAALNCRALGGQAAIPSRSEVEHFIHTLQSERLP